MTQVHEAGACPRCGTERLPGAVFCEQCAHDFTGEHRGTTARHTVRSAATPDIEPLGDESPLDTGWTGGR
ncbi:MAG: zinc-ribbon domain-containing protein [Lapillicoccus sp.]|jgi:uncharacterized OB-fold protein